MTTQYTTLRRFRHGAQVARLLRCQGQPSPGSDCTGLYYIELKRPDGSTLKLVGSPAPLDLNLDPAFWSVVP